MEVIDEILHRVRKYPEVRYALEKHAIRIEPTSENGFTVSLFAREAGYTVHFNGWHEELTDTDEALNCVAFGLSAECRLQEWRRGSTAYRWTVESWDGNGWVEDSTTGLFLFPFWRRKEVRYLQNTLIPPSRVSAPAL